MTRSDLICAKFEINASVMPSTKYSSESSPVRFLSGKTASDLISGATCEGFPEIHLPALEIRNEAAPAVRRSTPHKTVTNTVFLRPALFLKRSRSASRSDRIAAAVWYRPEGFFSIAFAVILINSAGTAGVDLLHRRRRLQSNCEQDFADIRAWKGMFSRGHFINDRT